MTIPADNRHLQELWRIATDNRESYRIAYHEDGKLIAYSANRKHLMSVELTPIMQSSVGDKFAWFIATTIDGVRVFKEIETGREEAKQKLETIKDMFSGDGATVKPLSKSSIAIPAYACLKHAIRPMRIRPVAHIGYFRVFYIGNGTYWCNDSASDFFVTA